MAGGAAQPGFGEAGAEREFFADGRVGNLGDQGLGFREVRLRRGDLRRRDAVREFRERVGLGGEEIPGEALVAVGLGNLAVERAELPQRRSDDLTLGRGKSAEDGAASGEVGLGVGGETPRLREAGGHGQPRRRPRLVVAVIAPGGEQDAARFVTHRRADGFGLIRQRVVETSGEALPSAGTRCDEIGAAEFAEASALFLERMAGIITPDDGNSIGRSVLREREVLEEDIAPELHGAATFATEGAQRLKMIQVDAVLTAFGDGLLAEALAELPWFVAADVHLAAAEVREVVVEQARYEVERLLVGT